MDPDANETLLIHPFDAKEPIPGTVEWAYQDDEKAFGYWTFATYDPEPFSDAISIVRYADGSVFTTTDWQEVQPDGVDDIDLWKWMEPTSGRDAVIIAGWPRLFPV